MNAREAMEKKGKLITSLDELLTQENVIFAGKPIPISWCYGWTLKQAKKNIDRKLVYAINE